MGDLQAHESQSIGTGGVKWICIYDKYELELILREAGFNENTECGFRRGIVPDIDKLDIESYKEHSLYLESTK